MVAHVWLDAAGIQVTGYPVADEFIEMHARCLTGLETPPVAAACRSWRVASVPDLVATRRGAPVSQCSHSRGATRYTALMRLLRWRPTYAVATPRRPLVRRAGRAAAAGTVLARSRRMSSAATSRCR